MIPSNKKSPILTSLSPTGSLLWEDDFNGTAGTAPNSATWTNQMGRYGASSGENQYYTLGTANAFLDGNSNLVITAKQETTPDSQASPNNFTSARIVSLDKKTFDPPCRVSVRAKVPYTKGLLPAIWTMGQDAQNYESWPRNGEIDIMEIPAFNAVGGDPNRLSMNLHGPQNGSPNTHVQFGGSFMNGVSLTDDYHIYGIDWYPDRIIWHLDGQYLQTITQSQWNSLNGSWTPFSGSLPHYLMLNVAVGNSWTGDPSAQSSFPQSMYVDWVKIWRLPS